jgi:2-polyprenyl-3-methyl-5-hydroxy-6-metoxy-1,4-benzoquinol methylase
VTNPSTALRPCPSCGNDQNLAYLWGTRIIQCPRCSLGYVDRLPTMEELNQLYDAEFFKGESAFADYVGEKSSLERNFQMRIKQLLKFNRGGKLFEAGCAHGFFLNMAKQYWDVKGIDISPEAIDYARDQLGLDAAVGDFESYPPEANTYDVIAMWDTIEHLYDPFLAVQESAKGLKPGGILALTTGDVGALMARIQRSSWRLFHGTHLYYFSKRSIAYLLEKHGLEMVQFTHEPSYRTLRQYTRVLTYDKSENKNKWRHDLVQRIDKLPLLNLEIPLNLFDIMFVIARKPVKEAS